jgi:hypothetical protein
MLPIVQQRVFQNREHEILFRMTVAAALEGVPVMGICRVFEISPSNRRCEVHGVLLSVKLYRLRNVLGCADLNGTNEHFAPRNVKQRLTAGKISAMTPCRAGRNFNTRQTNYRARQKAGKT